MSRVRHNLSGILAIALVLSVSVVSAGSKKAYNTQTSHTFANTEQVPAHGLVVALSAPAEVVTVGEPGAAGPFRNVSGNGSSQVTLTNPDEPIGAAGSENSVVELVFRSQKGKLQIKSWWWIDERGKRVGKKQKG